MRALLLPLLLAGAQAKRSFEESAGFKVDARGCVDEFSSGRDYFPDARRLMSASSLGATAAVVVANDFSVEYFSTFKVVGNLRDNRTYVVHQCGTPDVSPADLPERARGAPVFSAPAQAWSTGATAPLVFLGMLGLNNRADVVDMSYVTSACLHKLAACSETDANGHAHISAYDAGFASNITQGDSEIHFVDAFSTGATGGAKDVSFDATTDPGLLNRAEWIKFVAAFFNLEPLANHIFAGIRQRFEATSNAIAAANVLPPTVAFASYNAASNYPGYEAPESWSISGAEYKLEMIQHAGGKAFKNEASAASASFASAEDAKAALQAVDCIVDETYAPDPTKYNITTFYDRFNLTENDRDSYPFLKKGCVIRLDKRLGATIYGSYGMDWFESAIAHPDVVVKDLASHIHNGVVEPSYVPVYMRNIAKGESNNVITPDDCEDEYATCGASAGPPPSTNDFFTTTTTTTTTEATTTEATTAASTTEATTATAAAAAAASTTAASTAAAKSSGAVTLAALVVVGAAAFGAVA